MTFYKPFALDITQPQLKKASGGKVITLTAKQLQGSGAKIWVHPEVHAKLTKAKRANRGTRTHLSPEGLRTTAELEGGSVGSFLKGHWGFAKNDLYPTIKPALSGVLDAAAQPVATALGPYGVVAPLGRMAIKI